ncbi:MAG: hypothetical protein IJ599_00600, partial [Alphaproteobacteria bacterium]|nr:hypothetical protein [Alphaproteobacteria bacterium]
MLKKFLQLCLGALLCFSTVAMEEKPMRDTGLFGVLPIKTYDTSKVPNENLIDGFLDHCCVFPQKFRYENEDVSKTLQIEHDTLIVNKRQFGTVARIFAKDELSKHLDAMSKYPTGEKLIKVIYSKYVEDTELPKVPFLEVLDRSAKGHGSEFVLFPDLDSWQKPLDKKEVRCAIKLRSADFLENSMGLEETLVHEMVHWKDFLTQSCQTMYQIPDMLNIKEVLTSQTISRILKENFRQLVHASLHSTFKPPFNEIRLDIKNCNPILRHIFKVDPALIKEFNAAIGEENKRKKYENILLDVHNWMVYSLALIFYDMRELSALYGIL